jgi:hypothetical protein
LDIPDRLPLENVTDPESGKSVVGEETAAKQIGGVAFIQIRLAFFRAA